MYLKRVEIQGFKSFADKIVLDFDMGITSVVGPNGSGKSNIADAVRWVLGEQSIKTLRGSRMEDVIFSGTESRKPVSFAEVSLTIDNSSKTLPVEFSEVTVTRRLFRSGESEYLINKVHCRLKDIHELFLDTGLGRDGYSIIGQGRVDDILSNRSEDRRLIFEEASGIMKYKVRKAEAERKLELTEGNLVRIKDIISELESHMEPLKAQSESAKKYLRLRQELKEIEVSLFLESISKSREKLKEMEDQLQTVHDDMTSEKIKLDEITNSNKGKTEILKGLEEQIEAARQEFYSLEGTLERSASEIALHEERMCHLAENINRIEEELLESAQKIVELDKEESTKSEKVIYLKTQHLEYGHKLEEYETKLQEMLATLDDGERDIERLKTGIMDKMDLQSDKRTQLGNVRNHMENLQKRVGNIDQELAGLGLDKDRANMKKEQLGDDIEAHTKSIKSMAQKRYLLKRDETALMGELEEARKKLSGIRAEIQGKAARARLLEEMERNLEGYHRSVKEILKACQESPDFGHGIHGALAQLITVEEKYDKAIEMSLGSALQNIVTNSEEDAKKAIQFLKNNKLGRASFLPISSVRGRQFENHLLDDIQKSKGFCGVASELVQHRSEHRGIILQLLGKVVIVKDIDAGISMARSFGYSFKIVTLEGDVLNTGGSMSGGSLDSRTGGILGRHREIAELHEHMESLKNSDMAFEKQCSLLQEKIRVLDEQSDKLELELKDLELSKIRDESHLSGIEENLTRITAKAGMLTEEKKGIGRQLDETGRELQKVAEELIAIEKDIADSRVLIADHQERHKEARGIKDDLYNDITDFKISVNSIAESLQTVEEAVGRIRTEKDKIIKSTATKSGEKLRSQKELQGLEEEKEELQKTIKVLGEEKAGKTLSIDRLSEKKKVMEEELSDIITRITDSNKRLFMLQEEFNRIEVKTGRMQAEMEQVQNRLWEDYELTYSNALPYKKEISNIGQAQKAINELRTGIRELGAVNVGAIDEYVKTKERFEFMSLQKNDLEDAKNKLQTVVREITAQMKEQFMEQFMLINENFCKVFKELFEGGKAELILEDGDNILESGIEIHVQPPGKKLQNMMLLSGGERAFTAIALLFSILRLRPSPFCILDEIEAALDDANINRFGQYLKGFTHETQFIMVTHRKGTMEASDALYGVTMQERGISKVFSMKLNEKAG